MTESDIDLEHTIVRSLMSNSEFFTKTVTQFEPKLFESTGSVAIIDQIKKHFIQFDTMGTFKEIGLAIKENVKMNKQLKEQVLAEFKMIARDSAVKDTDFLLDISLNWIKRRKLTLAIYSAADVMQQGGEFAPIIKEVEEAVSVDFSGTESITFDKAVQDRIDYYQKKDVVIPSGLDTLDKKMGGGFRPSSLIMLVSQSHGGKCSEYNEELELYISDEELERIKASGVPYEVL